jgi:uncharacterized protein (TIGR03083 family)
MLASMDVAQHCAQLQREGEAFAALVAGADLDKTVVTCPDWDLAELFRHVGGLYRWSATLVRDQIGKETWRASMPIPYPEAGDDWGTWIRDGLADAVATFRASDPTARVWAWGSDQHARFWPRRMLFETVVHRRDAEITMQGAPNSIDPVVAVDGIDEFFELLPSSGRWNEAVADFRSQDRWSLTFAAGDTDDCWRARVGKTGFWWDRTDSATDATVTGNAGDLFLWLLGRGDVGIATTGEAATIERWRAATAF